MLDGLLSGLDQVREGSLDHLQLLGIELRQDGGNGFISVSEQLVDERATARRWTHTRDTAIVGIFAASYQVLFGEAIDDASDRGQAHAELARDLAAGCAVVHC